MPQRIRKQHIINTYHPPMLLITLNVYIAIGPFPPDKELGVALFILSFLFIMLEVAQNIKSLTYGITIMFILGDKDAITWD